MDTPQEWLYELGTILYAGVDPSEPLAVLYRDMATVLSEPLPEWLDILLPQEDNT